MSESKSTTDVGESKNSTNDCNGGDNKNVVDHSNLGDDQSTLCNDESKNNKAVENEQVKLNEDKELKPCVINGEEGTNNILNTENNGKGKSVQPFQDGDDVYENNHDVDEKAPLSRDDAQSKEGAVRDEMGDPDIPIDRGWAWMVVLGAFCMHIVVIGGCKSFGVLYVLFKDKYEASDGALTSVTSLPISLLFALAVFANMLAAKLTCRTVMFMGGILGCAGFFLSAFMSDFVGVVFTFGIMGGVAFSMCYSPGVVMVGQHFRKYRSLANGIAVAGSGVGTFIIPNVMRMVVNEYGLGGCLIVFSGIVLNLSAFALLFRPWSDYKKKGKRKTSNDEMKIVENLNGDNIITDKGHVCTYDKGQESGDGESRILRRNGDEDMDADDSNGASNTEALIGSNGKESVIGKPVKKKTKLLDWTLLFHPVFFIYALSSAFATPGYGLIFVMLPDFAEENGHSRDDAALVTSIIGISDLVGRLFFGWFSDLNIIPKRWGFISCMALSAVLNLILPSITSFAGLVCYAVAFGLFCGAFITLTPVLLAEDLGTERLGSSFGLTNVFMAIAFLSGPPICGGLKDMTGSWDAAFYFIGGLTLLGALLPVFQPCGQRYVAARERRNQSSPAV